MSAGDERGAAVRTFLIADIRGYTRFTAANGDEAASRLAMRFAAIAGEGVAAWDGELVELRGDEALAVFSSARQALRAAVELQAAFTAATGDDPTLPMTVGIGLDAGEAVPVEGGYRGAALNMAARLCSAASAGTVLATRSLVTLAGPVPGIVAGDPEPMTFKGIEAPVDVVRITDADGRPAPTPFPVEGLPPTTLPAELEPLVPLVGRTEELQRLRWHWRRAAAGDGRVAIVSGPPGIGKTRLAAELAGEVAAAGLRVHYLPAGRPIPEGVDTSADDTPTLLIADDVDAAGPAIVELALRLAETAPGSRRLVVLVHRREAPGPLVARLEALVPRERRILLGPLDTDAVRRIVALYAGHAADDAPVAELTSESGGVPASIHRLAGSWARVTATRRLGSSAERAAAERRGLRAAEADLMAHVSDLELARERERLFVGDPTIDPVPDAPAICPYKGLAAFEVADADFFFGRERLISELVARFVGSAFLALVGDSGSGKSSALRAGLLPALGAGVLPGSEAWPQVTLRPGEHPVAELGRALARLPGSASRPGDPASDLDAIIAALPPGGRLVVVVDQFEEVFNATRDDAERTAFLDLLTTERPGLKVIVSLRADHYGRCAAYPALARRMGTDQVLVGPLSSVELAAVIEHPAQRAGLRVEPALVAALVHDAGDEPGVLPLLSTALLELWQAREGSRLTMAAYRASGGLHGAIARLAERTWSALDPHRRSVARSILLRLAGPGEGSGLVRRRVALAELDADRDPAIEEVLGTLTAARLLTTGDGHVEVAHEALLREWPRLQEWLAEDAAGREVRLHLIDAARDWEASGRDAGDLYRGARLATALEWSADHGLEMNESERTFLEASRRAAEQDVERQRRTNRRLRLLLAGTAGLLVVALGAGVLAFDQGRRAEEAAAIAKREEATAEQERANAERERASAEQSATLARSRELLASAIAARDEDPALAKLLALQATTEQGEPTFQSTSALHDVLAADPLEAVFTWPAEPPVDGVWMDLAPDASAFTALVDPAEGADRLESRAWPDGALRWAFPAPVIGDQTTRLWDPFHTPDGTRVVAATYWDSFEVAPPEGLGLVVLDAASGDLLRTIPVDACGIALNAVTDGAAAGWLWPRSDAGGCDLDARSVRLVRVDLEDGDVRVMAEEAPSWSFAAMDASGRRIAFSTETGARVVDGETGDVIRDIEATQIPVMVAHGLAQAVSPDGRWLLFADRPPLLADLAATGPAATEYVRLPSPGGEGSGYDFDGAGSSVFNTSRDGKLRRWAIPSGQLTGTWPGAPNVTPRVSADGRHVLVGGAAAGPVAMLFRVDAEPRGDTAAIPTCQGFTASGSLSVAAGVGAFVQACDGMEPLSGMVQVLDTAPLTLRSSVPDLGTQRVAVSPDGELIATQQVLDRTQLGPLVIVDAETGAIVRELEGTCRWDQAVERPGPGCAHFPERPFPFWMQNVAWSPDGRWVAAMDDSFQDGATVRHVAVWDAESGRLAFLAPDPDPIVPPAGSPGASPSPEPRRPVWWDLLFTPDSQTLLLSETETGRIVGYGTDGWQRTVEATVETPSADDIAASEPQAVVPRLFGWDAAGRLIISDGRFSQQRAPLYWLDPGTMQVVASLDRAHDGSLKGYAVSPDGTLLATGSSDGTVRIWDTATQALTQEVVLPSQAQGMAFVDGPDRLLVAPDGGGVVEITTDPGELLALVRGSLSRAFTDTECATYGIDPCPSLEQLRSGEAPAPSEAPAGS